MKEAILLKLIYEYFYCNSIDKPFSKVTYKELKKVLGNKKIFLFGAGEVCKEFIQLYSSKFNIEYIIDNDTRKYGTALGNIKIKSPSIFEEYNISDIVVLVVTTSSRKDIENQLRQIGIENIFLLADIIYNSNRFCMKLFNMRKRMLENIERIIKNSWNYICRRLAINRNKIVIMNTQSEKGLFACNPKYITLEMLKRNLPYRIVWLSNSNSNMFPKGIKLVKNTWYNRIYQLNTSKLWLDNNASVNDNKIKKKKGQVYIQTWHASITLKNVGFSVQKNINEHVNMLYTNSSNITDLYVTSGENATKFCRKALNYGGKVLETGDARDDILIKDDLLLKNKIKKKLNIDLAKKIVIYAPTFREYLGKDRKPPILLEYGKLCDTLKNKFGKEWIVLLRLHPFIENIANIYLNEEIIDVTPYPDIQELLLISDVLITDYSSNIFDFALTGKPAFFFAPDIKEYIERDRGFWVDYYKLPFSVATNNDELNMNIMKFNDDIYQNSLKKMYSEYGFVKNGNATQKIVDEIIKYMK